MTILWQTYILAIYLGCVFMRMDSLGRYFLFLKNLLHNTADSNCSRLLPNMKFSSSRCTGFSSLDRLGCNRRYSQNTSVFQHIIQAPLHIPIQVPAQTYNACRTEARPIQPFPSRIMTCDEFEHHHLPSKHSFTYIKEFVLYTLVNRKSSCRNDLILFTTPSGFIARG